MHSPLPPVAVGHRDRRASRHNRYPRPPILLRHYRLRGKDFRRTNPGLTQPWGWRIPGLGAVISAVGLVVAYRAGAGLASRLGIRIGRDTLLRVSG